MSLTSTVEPARKPGAAFAGSPIDRLFVAMLQLGASDLHLCVGIARADSERRPHPGARSEHARSHRGIPEAADRTDHARRQPRRVCGEARYRLRLRSAEPRQVPRERVCRSQGARRRVSRHPVRNPHGGEAGPFAAHPEPLQAEQGPRAGDGSDRIGQVDDALRDDRLHQPHARRAHHHDRRSDRVRAPEQQVPHQPARGAHAHRLVQGGAPGGASRRSGHRARRRAAGSRDRGDCD